MVQGLSKFGDTAANGELPGSIGRYLPHRAYLYHETAACEWKLLLVLMAYRSHAH
jgi:hypothetical protein